MMYMPLAFWKHRSIDQIGQTNFKLKLVIFTTSTWSWM